MVIDPGEQSQEDCNQPEATALRELEPTNQVVGIISCGRYEILNIETPSPNRRKSQQSFVDVAWDAHCPYPILSETESYEMPASQPTVSIFSEKIS